MVLHRFYIRAYKAYGIELEGPDFDIRGGRYSEPSRIQGQFANSNNWYKELIISGPKFYKSHLNFGPAFVIYY